MLNRLLECMFKAKPVRAVAAMGLVPMSPVTLVVPVVVTPDLLKMAKSPAVPRSTVGRVGLAPATTAASRWRGLSRRERGLSRRERWEAAWELEEEGGRWERRK